MSHWLDALAALSRDGTPAVIVTVVCTRGSAPRAAGTHMIVAPGALHGTIGGGHLEFQAIGIARDVLAGADDAQRLRRFPLGASLGQCCGGIVNLLFEPVAAGAAWVESALALRRVRAPFVTLVPTAGDASAGRLIVTADAVDGTAADADAAAIAAARAMLAGGEEARLLAGGDIGAMPRWFAEPVRDEDFTVVLFGAGHVGCALARVLGDLPCRVTWVDARAHAFPDDVPANAEVVCSDAPEAAVEAAPPGAYFLVMTHEHAQDERIAECILKRGDFAYFGLIGSTTKRRRFEQRMARRGMRPERFAAMTCPIGIAGVTGKAPAIIAVAVAAELLQTHSATAAQRPLASPAGAPERAARRVVQ